MIHLFIPDVQYGKTDTVQCAKKVLHKKKLVGI